MSGEIDGHKGNMSIDDLVEFVEGSSSVCC